MSDRSRVWSRMARARWVLGGIAALLWVQPVRDTPVRVLLLAAAGALWVGLLFRLRGRRAACAGHLGVTAVAACLFLLPGRAHDGEALRRAYVRALLSYEGTPYVWGGETRWGIDCSGLVRCALVDAARSRGLWTANPDLVRLGARVWLQDCSAKELGRGYRGRLRPVLTAPSLNEVDYAQLLPGDVAVVSSGTHTLAYVGERTWIQADPNPRTGFRVVRTHAPSTNGWFGVPVTVLRWQAMEH